jgi:hypothetical protein
MPIASAALDLAVLPRAGAAKDLVMNEMWVIETPCLAWRSALEVVLRA